MRLKKPSSALIDMTIPTPDPIPRLLFSYLMMAFLLISYTETHGQDRTLTPLDVAKLEHVDDVIISPDGTTIAFSLHKPANPLENNVPAQSHLYIWNAADSSATPFITSMDVNEIAFRPKHKAITFLGRGKNDNSTSLYQIALAGGEPRKLFSHPTSIASYSWARDGYNIAFMAKEGSRKPQHALPYQPEVYEENMLQRRGYVTDIRQRDSLKQLAIQGSVYAIRWAPDMQSLAVAAAPTPRIDDYYMSQRIYITNRNGSEIKAEVDHSGKLGRMEWSPNSRKLAIIASADMHDPSPGRLFVVPAIGGEPTRLSPDYEGQFEQIAWVDSTTIQYLASKGVWSTYGTIKADGTEMRTDIAPGETVLKQFARTNTTKTVFIAEKSTHPAELYLQSPAQPAPSRITRSNPWLANVRLGNQKVVTWKADDGLELQGILVYPTKYTQGARYPLITVVHGGPESHYDNGWLTSYSNPGQVASGEGYFVFYPNYRGSTGRGVAFAKSSQGDMAGAEFDDIVRGVDDLVLGSIADSARIGVTGGSYGGYATAWLSTRYTDRFAAGVMFAGISNAISKWGTTDIPEELYLVHSREHVWENYQKFLERSPIFYAGQAKTPLLIMSGKEDTRVDPGQSYELYRHIKTRTETPVRLVLYPGEGHGNRNATAQYDYNLRMMRWFNKYLKGEANRPDATLDDAGMFPQN